MPLLAVLDEGAHGALDDSLKSFYVQNTEDKSFYLDIAPDEAAKVAFNLQKQFDAKKKDLERVHGEKTALAQKFKPFEEMGKTADEIRAAMSANQPEDITKLIEKHNTELEQIKSSYETPMAEHKTRAEKLEAQVRQSLESSAISRLVADYGLDPEVAPNVLASFIKAVPKEEGSDEYTVGVFDNGSPALIAGQPMKPEQLVTQWREQGKYKAMLGAGTAAGTGLKIGAGGRAFTVSREASKNNPKLYQTAKAEADKAGAEIQWTD